MILNSVLGKDWISKTYSEDVVNSLKNNLNISEILSRLIAIRKINIDEVNLYLNPKLKDTLPNPFVLKDMDKSVERCLNAIIKKEKIGIFGDYDVDGATSTALAMRALKAFGASVIESDPDAFDIAIDMRDLFMAQNNNAWSPMQFSNEKNIECHQTTTAPEIHSDVKSLGMQWGAFVHGAGTGGTIEGVRKYVESSALKTKTCMVIPAESPHKIQGIGDGKEFLAKSADMDAVEYVPSDVAIAEAQAFARQTGLLVGISSGANIYASKKYVEKHFKNNYGNTDNFIFPVTHKTVNKWYDDFIKKRFELFGDYQDAIDKENDFLFHSYMASSMNCGLLTPQDVIDKIRKLENKIPMNSYEGYIRQLFWREYQRYCYIYFDFTKKNYFGNKKKLTKEWYSGEVGCEPVDDCIKKAFEQGYLNHI